MAEGELLALEGLQAGGGMHRDRHDPLGGLLSDLFDVHSTGGRSDHCDPSALAVQRQAQVQLALDLRSALDVNLFNRQPCGAGLLGHESLAEHAGRGIRTAAASCASFTPPALPRPPACTCALTTQNRAAERRSSGECFVGAAGDLAFGTATP